MYLLCLTYKKILFKIHLLGRSELLPIVLGQRIVVTIISQKCGRIADEVEIV